MNLTKPFRGARGIPAFIAAMLLGLSLVASLVFAQSSGGLAGKWKMASTTPNGDAVDWMLTVKQDGSTLSATVSTGNGEEPAQEFKVDGASVHMKTQYDGNLYDIDLKLNGDKLTGKWSGNGDSGVTNGTRIVAAAAQ